MDRLNQFHQVARVDITDSFSEIETGHRLPPRPLLKPLTRYFFAVFGFVCCGIAVIAAAGTLAFQVQ